MNSVPDFKNFDSKLPFLGKFGPKIKSASFSMKIGTQPNLRVLISNSVLDFQNFNPKLAFWGKFGPKIEIAQISIKIGTQNKSESTDFKFSTRF